MSSASTRTGKIARLPRTLRDELNRRIDDGEPSKDLLLWLNGDLKVREILAAQFGNRDITEQNLSEWRTGGFRDWLSAQDHIAAMKALFEQSESFVEEMGGPDQLALRMSGLASQAIAKLLGLLCDPKIMEDPEQRTLILSAVREITQLRRADTQAENAKTRREKEAADQARLAAKERRTAEDSALTFPNRILLAALAETHNLRDLEDCLPPEASDHFRTNFHLWKSSQQYLSSLPQAFASNPSKSDPIRPAGRKAA